MSIQFDFRRCSCSDVHDCLYCTLWEDQQMQKSITDFIFDYVNDKDPMLVAEAITAFYQARKEDEQMIQNIQCKKCKGLHYDYHQHCVICGFNEDNKLGFYDWCVVLE